MGVRGYKTFFMLNLAEHEILNAHQYKNVVKFSMFQAQMILECYLFLLIHVEMPRIVGYSTILSWKNVMLS